MKKILIAAITTGVLAIALLFAFINNVQNQASKAPEIETETIVVANQDIEAYTEITEEMLTTKEVPVDTAHELAATDTESVVGMYTDSKLVVGEEIITSKLYEEGEKGDSLSYQIPKGMRAMSIAVDQTTGISGNLQVGDLIDITCITSIDARLYQNNELTNYAEWSAIDWNSEEEIDVSRIHDFTTSGEVSKVVIEAAKIAELGSVGEEEGYYSTVTVLLTPHEASVLSMAQQTGSIYISLRSREDYDIYNSKLYTAEELLTEETEKYKYSPIEEPVDASENAATVDAAAVGTALAPEADEDTDKIAKEVIAGKWGNNGTRKQKLEDAGYDYDVIQSRVNEMLQEGK